MRSLNILWVAASAPAHLLSGVLLGDGSYWNGQRDPGVSYRIRGPRAPDCPRQLATIFATISHTTPIYYGLHLYHETSIGSWTRIPESVSYDSYGSLFVSSDLQPDAHSQSLRYAVALVWRTLFQYEVRLDKQRTRYSDKYSFPKHVLLTLPVPNAHGL